MITTKTILASRGKRETHAIITIDDPTLTFEQQLNDILIQYEKTKSSLGKEMQPVFRRWFLSDAVNQQTLLPDDEECATSVVEQPPLNLTKIALWVWFIEDAVVNRADDGRYTVEAFGHTHVFEGGCMRPGMDPYHAMLFMLTSTHEALKQRGGSLLENCVRTWIFVQDVDVDYPEVVKGRNQTFEALGLTPSTRFIASTGIGGKNADRTTAVTFDSYSVLGLNKGKMQQVNAPDHLSPTYEYGVAFERATSVEYDDRRHLFVSGTASINHKGEVVWQGDVRRQTQRMWENVESLLKAASFGWEDVGHMLVYLRDPADYAVVKKMFEERFPETPYVILHAPVCRTGWLVEMECMAMKKL